MPKRIGKYEITAEIGRGGFSRVYRGFDPNVNRPVAIKVSTRESDPEHLSRFRNEASAAGNLRHENIVTIHDYGDDDGLPYLVMELLDGRDLYHIMRDGPKLSLLEKMQIMSQVGEGLRCAHLNGVVHRDIKPANVMVLSDSTVKILDFGIARMTGEVSRLTQSGYLVGTPLYMSPEQLQGADADALCDVWAFGVLYFELLTGQHPFLSQDNTRLIRNITIVNPPSVHSLTRGIPEGLAQVIRRALTKERRRRYQSIEEVLVDTNPILALLQREQTTGLVNEAQFYRSSGQLAAARQSSRKALEIDPSDFGAQQLLKSIQHEMQAESLAAPEVPVKPAAAASSTPSVTPPPVAPRIAEPVGVPAPPPPLMRPVAPLVAEAEVAREEEEAAAPVVSAPVFAEPEIAKPVPVRTPMPAPPSPSAAPAMATPMPVAVPTPPPIAPAVAALMNSGASVSSAVGLDTPPSSSTQQRLRPGLASGAAAAIAAAVAAAKARQAEEEAKQQLENRPEEEVIAPSSIKSAPLVVTGLTSTARAVPTPAPTPMLKRTENGSTVFLTDDPLVVKRPASAVMTQRRTAEASAAVATPRPAPPPPPPTRLPGTKAIPASVSRASNGDGDSRAAVSEPPPANDSRRLSENLPMRRPPSEVYSKGKRRSSSSIFAEKQREKKPFPWPVVGFVVAAAFAAAAIVLFALKAPKLVDTPALQPDKLTFTWKQGTPKPGEQILKMKGGAQSSSFMATSSDEDWLSVTPTSDDPTNRSWKVKVDPVKVGVTGPNGASGWIDVASTEGFKTSEEVIVKVVPGDAAPGKGKKGASVVAPNAPVATVPLLPATADKRPPAAAAVVAPSAPAKKTASDAPKAATTTPKAPAAAAKPAVVTAPPPPPAVKKTPAQPTTTADPNDVN